MLGFYYPGKNAKIDDRCQVPFLGNFWPCDIVMTYIDRNQHEEQLIFSNAEAAFQAFKFPLAYASRFQRITGNAAFQLKNELDAHKLANNQFQGYKSNWHCMKDVLKCKFKQNILLANQLKQTAPCFLLEHNSACGRDSLWSDNCDGTGRNWLGLQLMLLRETLISPTQFNSMLCHQLLDRIGNHNQNFPDDFNQAVKINDDAEWIRLNKEAYCAMMKTLKVQCQGSLKSPCRPMPCK